ncbi:hypothetical protein N9B82_00595 [Saprospiraceae bacterium]|nr:hypothetical protein [Saprospiraceae bacterium]
MRHSLFCFLVLSFIVSSCSSFGTKNLEDKAQEFASFADNLVACAASPENSDISTYIWHKTIANATDLRLWYSDTYTQVLADYEEEELSNSSLFQGFMGRFDSQKKSGAYIVSVNVDEAFIHSKPIEILSETQSTIWGPPVFVDQTKPLEPRFDWQPSTFDSESIYFHLLVNTDQDDAISATYSYDPYFQFYDTTNVVFNVTEKLNPTLEAERNYQLTLMQVSGNNWVSAVTARTFDTF